MLKAHAGIILMFFLSSALRTCVKETAAVRSEAKAAAAESKALSESAAGMKGAADELHYLSSTEKQLIGEHNSTLKSIEESAVLNEEKFNWEEFVAEKIEEEMWDRLKEWGIEKADEWIVTRQAAKSLAYSAKGDVLGKMIQNKYQKASITRDNVYDLLMGNKVDDLSIVKSKRIRILYMFSDDYAAWILARLAIRCDCDTDKMSDLQRIANERKIQDDGRIIRALNSCN
ncbi:MAG: hypothetical protein ACK5FT_05180 [Sphingomonadales bacterium]|jgi:hypothetical protein